MQDPRKPFIDKTLRATYPPGSIFKFVTALAALEDGQAAEDETIFCTGEYKLVGHALPLPRHARQGRPARGDPAVVRHLLLEPRAAHRPRSHRRGRARVRPRRADEPRHQRRCRRPHPDEGLVRGERPLQDRLRDQRGDRAGRRRGHRAADGDGVRGARERRHAVRAAGRRARRVGRRPHDRRVRAEGRARRSRCRADALDTWKRGMWKVNNEPGGTAYDHGHSRGRAR